MNGIYISVTSIEYNNGHTPAEYDMYEKVDDNQIVHHKLSWQEARRLQWELMKAGGEREYSANVYDPTICYSKVKYWACH